MKPRFLRASRLTFPFAVAIAALLAAPSASAAIYFWDDNAAGAGFGTAGASLGTWAAPTTGTVAGWSLSSTGADAFASFTTAAADTVNFGNGATGLAAGTITVSGTVNTGNMTFASGSGAITLSGGVITLGGGRTITANNAGNIISSEIALTGASTFSIGEIGSTTTRQLTLGKLSGTGGATFQYTGGSNGTGIILLNQASTYTGNTLISTSLTNANTEVRLGIDNALPTTTILTLGGADGTGTAPGRKTSINLNGNDQTLAGLTNSGGGSLRTFNVFSSTAAILTVNDSGNRTFSGLIGNGGTNISVKKQGAGNWTLSGANTYVGQTTVEGGTLTVANATALGTTAGNTVVSTGGRIFVGTASLSVAEAFNITGTGNSSNGAINIGGGATVTGVVFSGAITLGGNATIQGDGGTTTTFSGGINLGGNTLTFKESGTITVGTLGISGVGGSVIKNTGGTTNLNAAGSYDGDTTVNAGTLSLGNSAAAGTGGTINLGATGGSTGATLALSGTGTNVANAMTVRAGSSGIKTLTNVSTASNTYSGNIAANDNLAIVGAMTGASNTFIINGTASTIAAGKTVSFSNTGTSTGSFSDNALWSGDGSTSYTGSNAAALVIGGAKTYTGGSTVGSFSSTGVAVVAISSEGTGAGVTSGAFGTGTLTLDDGARLRATTNGNTTVGNTLTLAGNITAVTTGSEKTLTFSGPATLTGTRTLDVSIGNTDATRSLTFSGAIGQSGGSQGITKTGTGNLVLSGANTYTGTTTLNAGTINLGVAEDVDVSGPLGKQLANAAGSIVLGGGTLQYSAANQFDYSGRFSTAAGQSYNVNTNGQSVTWATDLVSTGGTLTKSGLGILTLSGTNSYTGLTTVSGGTLLATDTAALPGYNAASRVSVLSGATLAVRAGGAGDWTSTEIDDLLGATTAAFASGTSLGIDVATSFTYGNDVGATQAAKGLVKSGAGILTLSGANTYTGTTTIGEGTLAFTTANTLSGGLIFGATAGNATTGGLDLSAASATFGSLTVQTNTATANTIAIGAGNILTIAGNATVGFNDPAGPISGSSTTKLTATGLGELRITTGNFQLGGSITTSTGNAATLDMSGLSTFTYNNSAGTFRVGDPTNGNSSGTGSSTLILADTSTITALSFAMNSPAAAAQFIRLGSVANTINADTINIGASSNRSPGSLVFDTSTGDVTIRGTAGGVTRAAMTVAYGGSTTGVGNTSSVDLTGAGHSADLMLSTLQIGGRTGSSGVASTGTFSFENGTLDATGVTVGLRGGGTSTGDVTGTLNLNGGTVTIGTGGLSVGRSTNTTTGFGTTGTVNFAGSNATIGQTGGTSVTLGSSTVALVPASAAMNITGGSVTLAGDIVRGIATGTVTSTLTLNGASATLDMGGNDITDLTGITYSNGSLKNLGVVNTGMTLAGTGSRVFDQGIGVNGEIQGSITGIGIGLTKQGDGKLTLSSLTNSYDGATLVSAGTLFVTGSLTSDVTVSDTATLGGGGTVGAVSFGGGSFFDIALALGSDPLDSIGTISFAAAGFGIDNLLFNGAAVDWGTINDGTYALITGNLNSANLGNFGAENAFELGGGRTAYFQNGSLELVIIPEPSTALLAALGALALLRRRR